MCNSPHLVDVQPKETRLLLHARGDNVNFSVVT